MLEETFCHVAGIGSKGEERLWGKGFCSWQSVCETEALPLSPQQAEAVRQEARVSLQHLERDNPLYFDTCLPSNQLWRMFPSFRHQVAYLDIETTGLGAPGDYITTIVVYDGEKIFSYIQGQNLDDFRHDIQQYGLLITYNGMTFDLPFIRRYFGIPVRQAHIDLRYVLASLGYKGGLKGCEKQLGIDRKELVDVDGFFAVQLWWDYLNGENEGALQTLLAYNTVDVIDLELLMVMAYNMKLKDTPFERLHMLSMPVLPTVPFEVDMETVNRLRGW